MGRSENTYHINDIRWTQGGHRPDAEGRGLQ